MHGFMLYINNSEHNPLSIKSFYYTESALRSYKLVIKYLEEKTEYSRNTKQVLSAIKTTINTDNINCFKDKTIADLL